MYKIYPVTEFRHFRYETRGLREVDTGEHQEGARREKHAVDRAKRPSYFYYRSR